MTEEKAEKLADEILKKFAHDMVKIYDEEAKKIMAEAPTLEELQFEDFFSTAKKIYMALTSQGKGEGRSKHA